MRRENRPSVRILWTESNPQFAKSLQTLFADEGFSGQYYAANCAEVEQIMRGDPPDLLVLDIMTQGGEVFEIIKDIRANKLGEDPFVTIIGTSWDAQTPIIDHIYDCGADEAFIKPAPARRLMDRIFALALEKRQFLVTPTYVGPDRRRDGIRTDDGFRILVPSTLKMRAEGRAEAAMAEMRQNTIVAINEQRLQRGSSQLVMCQEAFLPSCLAGRSDAGAIAAMNEAVAIATDLKERAPLGGFSHMVDLCDAFIRITSDLRRIARSPNPAAQDPRNLKLVKSLCDALTVGFSTKRSVAAMVKDVSGELSRDLTKRIDRI